MITDLELTKLCAEAMDIRLEWDGPPSDWQPMYYEGKTYKLYDPLHNDAQALALVKRFGLVVDVETGRGTLSANLRRLIVECVAKMVIAGIT